MTILCNDLTLEQINAALLRIQRSIQTSNNNFQDNVEKAVANVTISGKTTIQKYDDSRLMAIVNELNQKYNDLSEEQASIRNNIVSLETILANVALDYDPDTNELTYSLGDYSNSVVLRDTTYTFSYDDETGAFTIVDDFTGETVFEETFNDTTYTFSFNNGVLTVHNNLLNTDQTFNFDARYYTESEIQSLILDKIPTQASAQNQLADKDFVNSSIATSTATFRGTVTSTTALAALTGDLNDYAFLQNIDPVTGQTLSYDRYKWVESGGDYGHWKYEYTLNNSSFTSDQWAAINSGITCQIVQDLIDGCYSCESNIDVYCDSTCKCTINTATPLCLCANAFNANATISTTTYPGACCTGTLVQSDLNDYQKKNIPTGIKINNTANLTCVDTILSCFNNTIQKQAYRKSWTSAHCRYIYLANIAVSSGPVSSSSYTLYLFATIYDSCPTKSYTVGTIHLDMSSGSNANGFTIRGYTDVELDCTTANYPRIVVTKDTTNNIYRLYLDTNYAYLNFDIQRNKHFGTGAWGDLCAYASLSGTEVFNSSTSPDEIKYIGGLVSILDKAAANESTPLLLCTGATTVGKSSSCSLTFNTCNGVLSANRFAVIGRGDATFAAQNLTASDIGLTAGCCYPLTCILESLMACKGYQAGTYIFAYSNAQNPIICETGGHAYCAVFTKEDAYNPVTYTWNMTRWRVTLNDGRSYCASAYSVGTAGIACWNVNGSTAVRICRNTTTCDGSCHLALLGDNTSNQLACIYVSNGCSATFNPATGALSAKCFVGDNQYHAVIPSPNGNTSSYYATIVLDSTCCNAETSIVFNSYNAEYHLLTWYNGTTCLAIIKDLWYVDCKYSIDSVGVSTCKANTDCIYIKYCGYRPTVVNSSRKIKCIIYGCTTSPSNVSWTAALKGIGCSRDTTCFGGCTYADACTDIRSGLISGGSFNGTPGTVNNGCLSFSDISFDNICNSTSKSVVANNITRRYLLTNQIASVGYITRWGLGLERGTTNWGTGLLSLGIKDDGTCFADYKFTHGGSISLTCCGTAKCITLEGCATKNVFTCCIGSASATQRYVQIKTTADRAICSVSFDFDFFSMNGTINLDNNNNNQYYAGTYYGCLCVSVCGYTCSCCNCFWLTYNGYKTLTLKSVYNFEVLCNTTTAPTGVTFCCFVKRPGSVTKVDVSDDASYNVLLSNVDNNAAMPSIGSNDKITFNPSTGILSVCGTCIGWYRTKSCCVKVTPTAQSSCWIYIGRFQTNGTGGAINTYNDLNLTIAATGNSMVSSANIKVLSANATSPTVIVQRQAGYSSSTGIDCVAVTRSGSVWNCHVCVWARVKSNGTNAYYLHLYRNMLPDTWITALTVCSAITGDVVGVGNVGINARAIQSNADLRIGNLTACTSTVAGCGGSIFRSGYLELFATTPFIDFHVNNSSADCSSRIIASTGSLGFNVNNATGCTASTESAAYTMCSNGLLYSGKGFIAGCVNAACPFLSINCACGQRMISMTKAINADVGLMLSHCADWTGTTYCNLGIEIGSGNVNRGFYHCKAETFEWLQYWDATCERHACPQCFACPIYGCSGATFAGCVRSCNTQNWSTAYSSNTYNTGYYLLAEYTTNENGAGNHDITIGGCVDIAGSSACNTMRFKASIRGNKCTVNFASAWVDSSLAADCLVFTRNVDTATCTFALRIYGKINSYYTRFNTTIDYLAAGDVNVRRSNQCGCLTFPNSYAAAVANLCGTVIPANCNCGTLVACSYKTVSSSIYCTFAAGSTSYILLGCYNPSNTAGNANELDLGFALGGGSLVEKGSLKLLLTTGCCNASCFSNNNIEAKFSNYLDSCYGVRNLIFTSGGNAWTCSIGIWLQVCNPGSGACTWAVDLLRNRIDDRFTSCLTCATSISGTRVCTIEVPSNTRNYYFNNANTGWSETTSVTTQNPNCCCTMAILIPTKPFAYYSCNFVNLRITCDSYTRDSATSVDLEIHKASPNAYGEPKWSASVTPINLTSIEPFIIYSRYCSNEDQYYIVVGVSMCCTGCPMLVETRTRSNVGCPADITPIVSLGNDYVLNPPSEATWLSPSLAFCGACMFSRLATSRIVTQCVSTVSSIKVKKDVCPFYGDALCMLKCTNIVDYRYKDEKNEDLKHVGIIAEMTNKYISGDNQDGLRVSDSIGLLMSAVKDIEASLTLWQRLKIKLYRKFIKPHKDKKFMEKLKTL